MYCNICDYQIVDNMTGYKLINCEHNACKICFNLYTKTLQCPVCNIEIDEYNLFENISLDTLELIIINHDIRKVKDKIHVNFDNIISLFGLYNNNIIDYNKFVYILDFYIKNYTFPINYNFLYTLILDSCFNKIQIQDFLQYLHKVDIYILDTVFLKLLFNKYNSLNLYFYICSIFDKGTSINYHNIMNMLLDIYNLDCCIDNNKLNLHLFVEQYKILNNINIDIPSFVKKYLVTDIKIDYSQLFNDFMPITDFVFLLEYFDIKVDIELLIINCCVKLFEYCINNNLIDINLKNVQFMIKKKINVKIFKIIMDKYIFKYKFLNPDNILSLCHIYKHILLYKYITANYNIEYNTRHLLHILDFNVLQYNILDNILKHNRYIFNTHPKTKIKFMMYSKKNNNIFKKLIKSV